MGAYSIAYLSDVVETQGQLFDFVAIKYPQKDTRDFIETYMRSKTRKYIDDSQAYVMTMDCEDLWHYFLECDQYQLKDGPSLKGFMPDHVYNDLMNSGRTVFVPLPKSYIYRLSGSIYDALSRGKIVYTNSKFYSNEYERRYPGICVYVGSVDDLIFQLEKKEEPYVIESFQKFLNDHSIERVGNEIKKMVTKVLK